MADIENLKELYPKLDWSEEAKTGSAKSPLLVALVAGHRLGTAGGGRAVLGYSILPFSVSVPYAIYSINN